MQQPPVLPEAGPSFGPDGRLSYLGVDGTRRQLAPPRATWEPASEAQAAEEYAAERMMARLAAGGELVERIETLCRRWIQAVSGEELQARDALLLLLTTLETSLETCLEEGGPPAGTPG